MIQQNLLQCEIGWFRNCKISVEVYFKNILIRASPNQSSNLTSSLCFTREYKTMYRKV